MSDSFGVDLTEAYWALLSDSDAVDPDKLLLLFQYMLTSYLSTLPPQRAVQVQVLDLLRGLLPKVQLASD